MLDGAADADILELLVILVDAKPDIGKGGLFQNHGTRGRIRLQARQRADRRPGVVQIARLETALGGGRVLDRNDVDFIISARLVLPVRVALENGALLWLPVGKKILAGLCHRLGGHLLVAEFLHGLL